MKKFNIDEKINGKKIAVFAGTALLTGTLAAGVGISLHEKEVDHRYEVCPITKILCAIPQLKEKGIDHQIEEINKEYEDFYQPFDKNTELGCFAHTFYRENYNAKAEKDSNTDVYITAKKTVTNSRKEKDGTFTCNLPEGYILTTDENGYPIGLTNSFDEKSFDECFVTYLNSRYYDYDDNYYNGLYFIRQESILELHR